MIIKWFLASGNMLLIFMTTKSALLKHVVQTKYHKLQWTSLLSADSLTFHLTLSNLLDSSTKHLLTLENGSSIQKSQRIELNALHLAALNVVHRSSYQYELQGAGLRTAKVGESHPLSADTWTIRFLSNTSKLYVTFMKVLWRYELVTKVSLLRCMIQAAFRIPLHLAFKNHRGQRVSPGMIGWQVQAGADQDYGYCGLSRSQIFRHNIFYSFLLLLLDIKTMIVS